jgi:tripartite-type tricarboxylate transporter receptor subunit TctC
MARYSSRYSLLLKTAGLLLALTTIAAAQEYPTKPVRLIIPFAPGGLNDTGGRVIATQLSARLGKQVVVENRTGAGGVVGTELVAHAPKDGYTLLIVSLVHTFNPWFYKLSYDPIKSFAPIAFLASSPNVLSTNRELPVTSVKELITLAKEKPGQLQYASGGIGSFMHMGAELFKLMADVDMLHVPFRGGGPALIDVIGGHTKLAFATVVASKGHARAGRIRALGVGDTKRHPLLPEVPTIAEAGVAGYAATNWIGIVAPAGTPAPIVEKLYKEISAALDAPEVQKQFSSEGAEILRMSSAEFGDFMVKELAKWGRVVKEAGIKAQ